MFTFERSRNPATYPVGPALSMYDPIYLGVDEFGEPVYIRIIYRNILAGGEPGGGKSGLLNIITAHAALSVNTRLVLFDGKQVELGMWDDIADEFVGPDLGHAITTMLRLQRVMDNRYTWLRAHRRRKVEPRDGIKVIVIVIDEIALYSATLGTEQEQKLFTALLRDLVARGRAAAMPVIAATQRPSVDIIPKSLRDLFGYRAAFRCTSSGSSDIVLGDGWSDSRILRHRPVQHQPGHGVPHRRRRHPPAHQSRLPVRRRHHHAGRLRGLDPQARQPSSPHPGGTRRLTRIR